MAHYADSALRVVVSGIRKGPVKRYDKGILEEDNIGYFFHDRGCNVESVRLVIDSKRGDASRGFGFVDFADQQSFQRALDLNGTHMPDIAGKDGCLHIEAARPATEETKKKQQELLKARHATEEMERELRLREARVTELMREVQRKRERQNVLDIEAQLEGETKKQDAIRKAQESLRAAEETLHRAIEVEDERTHAMDAIVRSVDGEQTRPHHEAEEAVKEETGESSAALSSTAALALAQDHAEEVTSTSESLRVRVRNTFLEYYEPPVSASDLVRTRTAPPEFLTSLPVSPVATETSGAQSPSFGQQEGEAGGVVAGSDDVRLPRWASIVDDEDSPILAAPWVARRASFKSVAGKR